MMVYVVRWQVGAESGEVEVEAKDVDGAIWLARCHTSALMAASGVVPGSPESHPESYEVIDAVALVRDFDA